MVLRWLDVIRGQATDKPESEPDSVEGSTLHDRVEAKDAEIAVLKNENQFLRETLTAVQEQLDTVRKEHPASPSGGVVAPQSEISQLLYSSNLPGRTSYDDRDPQPYFSPSASVHRSSVADLMLAVEDLKTDVATLHVRLNAARADAEGAAVQTATAAAALPPRGPSVTPLLSSATRPTRNAPPCNGGSRRLKRVWGLRRCAAPSALLGGPYLIEFAT